MKIDWLGTPQAVLAAIIIAVLVLASYEYWRWVERRTRPLEIKSKELLDFCKNALRDMASSILCRSELTTRAANQWHPWKAQVLVLKVSFASQKDQQKVQEMLENTIKRFLAIPNNHHLRAKKKFLVKSSKEQPNVRP